MEANEAKYGAARHPRSIVGSRNAVWIGLIASTIASTASAQARSPNTDLGFAMTGTLLERLDRAYQAVITDSAIRNLNRDAFNTLQPIQRISQGRIETTKFQDYYKGIEVMGSMAIHHLTDEGPVITPRLARFDLDTTPTLSPEDAVGIARAGHPSFDAATAPELKILPAKGEASARLVYRVSLSSPSSTIAGRNLIVDAHSGKVLIDVSRWLTIAPTALIDVYEASSRCQEVDEKTGDLLGYDERLCDRTVARSQASPKADGSALRAFANSRRTLEYYASHHGRDSYDGRGASLRNLVHIGKNFTNAFWDPSREVMAYGDGDGQVYGDLTRAADVAGHEMTHGVVSRTAGLEAWGQSGALNEGLSDFFGELIAADGNWMMGSQVFVNNARPGIRDLKNPGSLRFGYLDSQGVPRFRRFPAHMRERMPDLPIEECGDLTDNCWVHINSTIVSHAGYLMIQKTGQVAAERILYFAMTRVLTSMSDFRDLKDAALLSCQLLRYDNAVCDQVRTAFAEVGL